MDHVKQQLYNDERNRSKNLSWSAYYADKVIKKCVEHESIWRVDNYIIDHYEGAISFSFDG